MAKRSPILGYNHNVRYRGIVFHVQTEDSGIINPHVFSHLFHGGVILSTRKLVYDPDATEDVVKALMQAQHKAVLKDLRRGAFDDKIDLYLGSTPGLLPRESVADGEAAGEPPPSMPVIEAIVEPASAPVEGAAVTPPPEPVAPAAVEASDAGPSTGEPAPALAIEPAAPVEPPPAGEPAPLAPPAFAAAASPSAFAPAAADDVEPSALMAGPPPSIDADAATVTTLRVPVPETGVPPAPPTATTLRVPVPPPVPPVAAPSLADAAIPVAMDAIDSAPVVISMSREPSAPAIEVIEAMEPSVADLDLPAPAIELTFRPPALDEELLDPDDVQEDEGSPFESTTARSLPPLSLAGETDRVATLVDEPVEPVEAAEPLSLDNAELIAPILPEPRRPPSVPPPLPRRTTAPLRAQSVPPEAAPPSASQPLRVGEQLFAESSAADAAKLEPAVRPRSEPGRSQPIVSPVRVSFVSARAASPTLEPPPPQSPPSPPEARPPTAPPLTGLDVGVEALVPPGPPTLEDLLPPSLPPPPAQGVAPGATPPFGVPARTSLRTDTVPRLAGVPAPTPPVATPPALAPAGVLPPAFIRSELQPRAPHPPSSTAAIDDDDLLAAGLVESSDVAEIHAPPLPSAIAPPGSAPERPGQYHVNTRGRVETPASSRPPIAPRAPTTPPRPAPAPVATRPPPAAVNSTHRASPPPQPAPPPARPPTQRPPTRPPESRTEPARDVARADTAKPEGPPVTQPRVSPTPAARPAPRPRPTTGAGVVVSRPAVIVGAPARPSAAPVPPTRPRRARDGGADGLITERSLDEVILAYLSEDANEE